MRTFAVVEVVLLCCCTDGLSVPESVDDMDPGVWRFLTN